MIDLHVHTTISDGVDSLEEVVQKANALGIEVISVTDHDRCDAYFEENKSVLEKFNGHIIIGCELNSLYKNRTIHILAYDFDVKKLAKFIKEKVISRGDFCLFEYKAMKKKLEEKGIFLKTIHAEEEIRKIPPPYLFIDEIKATPEYIKHFEEGQELTVENLWWNYFGNINSDLAISFEGALISSKKIIEAIHNAGGKAFLAHPYLYGFNEELSKVMNEFVSYGLDGIECYYSKFTKEQTEYLLDYCNENNLFVSGGSDYHGERRANKIGTGVEGNLNISKDILKAWHKI